MKLKTILIVGGALAAAGLFALWYIKQQNTAASSKQQQAQWLMANNFTTGNLDQLLAFGADYISAWYAAAQSGQMSFALSGVNYNICGGKALAPGQSGGC